MRVTLLCDQEEMLCGSSEPSDHSHPSSVRRPGFAGAEADADEAPDAVDVGAAGAVRLGPGVGSADFFRVGPTPPAEPAVRAGEH
ncbi:hypothetical protein, partial [Streptomyces sp. MS191]|uniref:hypothetical protein n=1 Tax=Streptomyces sp. ms191 TaxID=1827978 RepID=UPI001C9CE90B